MAKGARASTIKSNNAKLKANVFGPIETARTERLSAKLLELASQPKPVREEEMKDVVESEEVEETSKETKSIETAMELDEPTKTPARKQLSKTQIKNRIEKRKSSRSRSSIVFPKYKDGKKIGGVPHKKK